MTFGNTLKHGLHRLRTYLRSDDPVEHYIMQSSDLYDLEFRMQQVNRGEAPFQVHSRPLMTPSRAQRR